MRCSAGIPKVMFSLKIGPYLSNSRSYTLYAFVKRSDLTKNSANDFKLFRGPGMSSKGRTEIFSVSDFAKPGVWLSSSDRIALVFWDLRKTAKGFKCWDLGRYLLEVMLEKAYMFPICCTRRCTLDSIYLGHEIPSTADGLASKLRSSLLSPLSKMANVHVLLFLLYFGQGLPYGFQVRLLPLLLRQEKFSLSKVGLSRLLSLPWIFKFSVAPLIDSLWSLNSWIIFGSIAMSLLCFISAFVGITSTMILLFCVFWMNLTSALQDVAVDAFAISLLKPSELGEKFLLNV